MFPFVSFPFHPPCPRWDAPDLPAKGDWYTLGIFKIQSWIKSFYLRKGMVDGKVKFIHKVAKTWGLNFTAGKILNLNFKAKILKEEI